MRDENMAIGAGRLADQFVEFVQFVAQNSFVSFVDQDFNAEAQSNYGGWLLALGYRRLVDMDTNNPIAQSAYSHVLHAFRSSD